MQDDLSMILKGKLNIKKSVINIDSQIKELEKQLKDVNIGLDLKGLEKELKSMVQNWAKDAVVYDSDKTKKEVEKTKKDFSELYKSIEGFKKSKESISFINVGDGDKLKKVVTEYKNELQESVSIIEHIDTKTGEMVSVEKNVTDNIEKRNKVREKEIELQNKLISKLNQLPKSAIGSYDMNQMYSLVNEAESVADLKMVQQLVDDYYKEAIAKEKVLSAEKTNTSKDMMAALKLEESKSEYIRKKRSQILEIERQISKEFKNKGIDTSNLDTGNIHKELNSLSASGVEFGQAQKTQIEDIVNKLQRQLKLEKDIVEQKFKQEEASIKINKMLTKLKDITTKNDRYDQNQYTDLESQLRKLEVSFGKGELSASEFNIELKKIDNTIDAFGVSAKKASSTTNSFSDSLKRFTAFYSLYDVFNLGKRAVSSMVDSIKELDASIVEVMKVTNLAGEDIDEFTRKAFAMSEMVGRTGTEMINATASFSRAGYELSEAMNLGNVALTMANVGDGMTNIEENANTLISVMKGFGEDTDFASKSLDILNNVSNKSAISFSDLSEGMKRASAVYSQSGVGIEKLSGLLVGANEIMMNIEKSSTGLVTISQRLRGVTEAFEEDPENISKLDKAFKKIAKIDIRDTNGQIRDTFSILQDLAKVYPSLTKNQQQFLGELAAGKRQISVLQSLLMNWESVEKAVNNANSATGSAREEQEAFLNSIQGKLNQMSNAWKELAMTTISSDFIKGVVTLTTNIIKLMDACGGLTTVILAVGMAFATWKLIGVIGTISGLVGGVKTLSEFILALKLVIDQATVSQVAFNTAMKMSIAGLVIAGVMALGYAIKEIANNTKTAKERMAELNSEIQKLSSEKGSTTELVNQYNELAKLSKEQSLTNEQQKEFLRIQNEIKRVMPEVNGYHDEFGNFLITEGDLLDEVNEKYKALIQAQLEQRSALASSMATGFSSGIRSKREDLEYELDYISHLKNVISDFSKNKGSMSSDDYSRTMKDYQSQLKDANARVLAIRTSMNETFEEGKNQIMEVIVATKDWNNASDETKDSIERMIRGLSDENDIEKFLKNASNGTGELVDGINLATSSVKGFKNGTIDMATYMSNMTRASNLTGMSIDNLADHVKTYTDKVEDATPATEDFVSNLEEVRKNASDARSDLGELNEAIEKVRNGQELTGEEIVKLRNKHEGLNPILDETTGLYKLQEGELIKVRDEYKNMSKEGIQAEIDLTKQKLQSVQQRIKLDGLEVMSLKSKSDVYKSQQALENAKLKQGLESQYGSFANIPESIRRQLNADTLAVSDDVKVMDEVLNELAGLYDELENFDIAQTNMGDKIKKDNSSSSDNPFQKDIDKIKQAREEIEREISIIQSKLDLSEMQGDTKSFDEYSDKMTLLLAKQKELADVEVNKFKALQGKYKKEEEQLTLNELIAESTMAKYADEKEYLEQTISLIQRKTDMEKRAYDDKVGRIELEQSFAPEDSNEWKGMEEEKMSLLLSMQESYQSKIKQLKELGLSNEQEIVRQYIDAWKGYEQQRIDMERNIAEKRKESELKRLNDLNTDLQEKEDLTKKHIENTIAMLREQYQEEKKMIEDNYKAKEEKLKKELDGYKKIIDAKKKSLQDEADTEDYEDKLQEYNKEIADMKNQAALLGKDETAVVEYEKLLDEIAKAEKEKEKYQRDYNLKLQQESLDKEYELYEQNINNELDALKEQKDEELSHVQDMLDSEVKLRREAIRLIEKDNDKLYKQLMKWAEETGSKTQDEITAAWEGCTDAIDGYNNGQMNVLDTLQAISDKLKEVKFDIKDVENSHWTDWDNNPSTGNGQSYNKPSGSTSSSSNSSSNSSGSQLSQKAKEQLNQQKYLHEQMLVAIETDNEGLKKWIEEERKKWGKRVKPPSYRKVC